MCGAVETGLLLAGLNINFNERAPLAGFITPCVEVWNRSGSFNSFGKTTKLFPKLLSIHPIFEKIAMVLLLKKNEKAKQELSGSLRAAILGSAI